MPLDITFQPMRVLIDGHDSEGKLILADGQLAAVIARLDGKAHPSKHRGWWHLEAGWASVPSALSTCSRHPKRLATGFDER
jgi:hypothetical protein